MLLCVFGFLKVKRLPQLTLKSVIVHTKDGHSMEGVLLGVYVDSVSLGHVSFYGGPTGNYNLEGDQVIPIENVSFIQDLGPPAPRGTQ